ncbi:MAG: helix-turn-helix domain-containing protein [Actinomycetota bacterium]|nr:helix-turn-helix domain-containing protein [Actinomycetota bacterium]
MLTVPQAARRTGRHPETLRRWIREGKLRSTKVGTQHFIDEAELDDLDADAGDRLPIPEGWWTTTVTGEPMPDVLAAVRRSRRAQ